MGSLPQRARVSAQIKLIFLGLSWGLGLVQGAIAATPQFDPPPADPAAMTAGRRLLQLGPGDTIAIQVYGQPDMSTTVNVADDGTVAVPLAGEVPVGGLAPAEAGARIAKALADGKFLVNPQVTVTLSLSRSQRVSVLGEVGTPGRYTIEANTSIFDLLAQAGGTKETSGDTVYLLRTEAGGKVTRYPINLRGLYDDKNPMPNLALQGGDSIFVPKAPQFYIFGEVTTPSLYKIEPGMTILQAIARAGGLTPRGSRNRFEVKRKDANGVEHVVKAKLTDLVQPNDVIRIKESIF